MINGKRVLGITLARGGSKGIFKKNITPVNGKPLITYTIEQALKSKYLDDYFVATDDFDIKSICLQNNCKVVDRKYVDDKQTSAAGILEVLDNLEPYDYIVEIVCTNPFKTFQDLDRVIELLDSNQGDSVVSVTRVLDNHPNRIKYIQDGKLIGFHPTENPDIPGFRRQDLEPAAYVRNGAFYGMTYLQLKTTGLRLGKNVIPYIMDFNKSINIDEPLDIITAESLLKVENK
jgi:CMP-N-acetylneuraminic acid synthetase